jgi:hypothetical protein
MKKLLAIVLLTSVLAQFARAEDKPSIELTKKSSFNATEVRNPFWPIGWKPAPKVAAPTQETGPEIPESAFVVSSITLDNGTRFAIVNGKSMEEGQVFGLQMGNQTYQLTVKAIEDGRVVLDRGGQQIVVALRRR